MLLLTTREIWKERNQSLFHHKELSTIFLATKIKEATKSWALAGAKYLAQIISQHTFFPSPLYKLTVHFFLYSMKLAYSKCRLVQKIIIQLLILNLNNNNVLLARFSRPFPLGQDLACHRLPWLSNDYHLSSSITRPQSTIYRYIPLTQLYTDRTLFF